MDGVGNDHAVVPHQRAESDPYEQLVGLEDIKLRMHQATERAVRQLRLGGATWDTVGKALGVSRQAASKRWGYLDGYGAIFRAVGSVALGTREGWIVCEHTGVRIEAADRMLEDGHQTLRRVVEGSRVDEHLVLVAEATS